MPKYNLALIPLSVENEAFNLANQFAKLADTYLLGKNSLPHVTLYQFEVDESEIASIWKRVCDVWNEAPIRLKFEEFSCITLDNLIFWASLLPDNRNKLHEMHGLIAKILCKPIKENFDPHMTLFNTRNKDYEQDVDELKNSFKPISDEFVLSLGRGDGVGQLTEIIFSARAFA